MKHEDISQMSLSEVRRFAAGQHLQPVGARPPFGSYVKDLWRRRSFIWTLASAKFYAKNEGQRLGQLWTLINPLLLIATYWFIFGAILSLNRGIENYVGFLAVGIILFNMSASTMTSGSRAIINNTGLVRALHFPRAVLPLSQIITSTLEAGTAVLLLLVIVPFTGDLPRWSWLLLPVVLLMQAMMQSGIVLILSRLVNLSSDLWNFIPVAVRVLRYGSGVFFSIADRASDYPRIQAVMEYQPFALQLTLGRQALLGEFPLEWSYWAWGLGYALILPIVGLWIFWIDEAKYGRA